MENPRILRKKLLSVIKLASLGAAVFVVVSFAAATAYDVFRGTPLEEFVNVVCLLLTIPSAIVSGRVGYKGGLLNEYVVNAVLGAVIFAIAAAFWQFCIKGNED